LKNIFEDVLFYAVKQLEQEIEKETDPEIINILQVKYSYWKQSLAQSSDDEMVISVVAYNALTEAVHLYYESQKPLINTVNANLGAVKCPFKCGDNHGSKFKQNIEQLEEDQKCKYAVTKGNSCLCSKNNNPDEFGDCLYSDGIINIKARILCSEALKLLEK